MDEYSAVLNDLSTRSGRVHFVGIGGIGMSALAQILASRGFVVSGSDVHPPEGPLQEGFARCGVRFVQGHRADHLPDGAGLVVHSSCIRPDNPEIVAARERGVPVTHRSQVLRWLMLTCWSVGVTGAHGKTTTTALAALIYAKAGLVPSAAIGGIVHEFSSNALCGDGNIFIAEADESDGTHAALCADCAIILNVDAEHLDHYKTIDNLIASMADFIARIKPDGILCYNREDPAVRSLAASFPGEKMSYGYGPEADLSARAITAAGERTTFEVLCRGASLGEFTTHLAGRHNVLNVLAATAAALRKRIPVSLIRQAVACYTGTRRRFEIKAAFSQVRVIEDYAHHPTEIEAVIAACRDRFSGSRVLVLFQPHRFSRTQYLYREFAQTLMRADRLVLTDVYSAFENPIDGVSTRTIYEEAVKIDPDRVRLVQKEEIPGTLVRILGERDIVLILGAGDINELTPAIISAVQEWTGACR